LFLLFRYFHIFFFIIDDPAKSLCHYKAYNQL